VGHRWPSGLDPVDLVGSVQLAQWKKSTGPPWTRSRGQSGVLGFSWIPVGRSATYGSLHLIWICCPGTCQLLLGFEARDAPPRRRASRRRRRGLTHETSNSVVSPNLAHTHQSTKVQRSAHSGARLVVVRTACGSASACACSRAAPSLGAGCTRLGRHGVRVHQQEEG
jgi:hypothetical protein